METQCITAHGAASFLKERTFENSDTYQTFICKECGLIAEYNEDAREYSCKGCPENTRFAKINMPYTTKLLINTLIPMNILPRIRT